MTSDAQTNHDTADDGVSALPEYSMRPIEAGDQKAVIDLFNYYVENTFAAYPEQTVPYEFFDFFLAIAKDYPSVAVEDADGRLLGFGMLRPHSPIPAFAHTAEITYFIDPALTGKGLGSRMLGHLAQDGAKKGITCILAGISSRNAGSIRFHEKNGFTECGRFRNVGRKGGVAFDVVWMQKEI
ncbi:GNAT family N-acetyltransferase [Methanoculleus taiwanensis]|nr:GNAT family N-acetyltransferase [Methanoculleus taiwanensis]